jgi:hypothetical protein
VARRSDTVRLDVDRRGPVIAVTWELFACGGAGFPVIEEVTVAGRPSAVAVTVLCPVAEPRLIEVCAVAFVMVPLEMLVLGLKVSPGSELDQVTLPHIPVPMGGRSEQSIATTSGLETAALIVAA